MGLFALYQGELHHRLVIESDEQGMIHQVFALTHDTTESTHTQMHNGIITGEWSGMNGIDTKLNGKDNIIRYLTQHTRPIKEREINRLILWDKIDFVTWEMPQPPYGFRFI